MKVSSRSYTDLLHNPYITKTFPRQHLHKQGTRVFRRREGYANLILEIVRAHAASTVGNTGRRGDFGSWEVEG